MMGNLSSSGPHPSPHCGTFKSPRGRDLNTRKLSAITRNGLTGEPLHCLGTDCILVPAQHASPSCGVCARLDTDCVHMSP